MCYYINILLHTSHYINISRYYHMHITILLSYYSIMYIFIGCTILLCLGLHIIDYMSTGNDAH